MEIQKDSQLFYIKNINKLNELAENILSDYYINDINTIFPGRLDENRIAVLGAFDTWPYMDLVSRILANEDYISITSRYIYHKLNHNVIRIHIGAVPTFASREYLMKRLLKQIINRCLLAIINYSVSAAHYIETDWCADVPNLNVIGIAYVRDTYQVNNCENLCIKNIPNSSNNYSTCKAINFSDSEWNAWKCIDQSGFCPFIQQDISKNVIEYYFDKRDKWKLIACNNLETIPYILNTELFGNIKKLSNNFQENFNKFFSDFNLDERQIEILLINKGLELLVYIELCSTIFNELIFNISKEMLKGYEIINEIIENLPSTKKESILEYQFMDLEKYYPNEINKLRGIFKSEDEELSDILSGLSKLKNGIFENYGDYIINFLIENEFIEELNAFWKITDKSNNLFNSIKIKQIIEEKINENIV